MAERPFYEACKAARKSLGIKQLDMAREIGVSNPVLNRWENGKGPLSEEQIEKLNQIIDRAYSEKANAGKLLRPKNESPNGRSVARIRELLGISQSELGKLAKMTQTEVSMLENGYRELEGEQLDVLINILADLTKEQGFDLRRGVLFSRGARAMFAFLAARGERTRKRTRSPA